MNELINALLLGIIEGITEFLPISSTGHLLIAEHWLGARSDLFNIAIQAGAILAVVVIYRKRLLELVLGLGEREHRDYAFKLALSFGVTAVLGLVVKKLGVELPETIGPVAWALLVGGFVMLAAETVAARRAPVADDSPAAIGWGVAALVGVAQVVAGVFPGTSRSAAAIFAALLFGRGSRVAATEFAFLVGIPTMFAATGYELLHTLKDGGAANEDWTALGVAFVVSALTAFAVVKWLLRYIQTHRFTVFSWYRIALGAALLLLSANGTAGLGQPAATPAAAGPAGPGSAVSQGASGTSRAPYLGFTDLPVPAEAVSSGSEASGQLSTLSREQVLSQYHKRSFCLQGALLKRGLDDPRTQRELSSISLKDMSGDAADRQERLDMINGAFEHVEQAELQCDETPEQLGDGSIYELALRAADAGDKRAASCYASGSFPMPAAMLRRPDLREHFRVNTARLIESGIEGGDWNMATIAQFAFQPEREGWKLNLPANPLDTPGFPLTMTIAPQGDVQRAYEINRLFELGAQSPSAARGRAAAAEQYGRTLTAEQRRRGDAWARTTFQKSFHGKGPGTNEFTLCP